MEASSSSSITWNIEMNVVKLYFRQLWTLLTNLEWIAYLQDSLFKSFSNNGFKHYGNFFVKNEQIRIIEQNLSGFINARWLNSLKGRHQNYFLLGNHNIFLEITKPNLF